MATQKISGSADSVKTSIRDEVGDRSAIVVDIEGLYSTLERDRKNLTNSECPGGYTVETSTLASTGDGMGKLTLRCVKYEEGASFSSVRSTFRIDMQEVVYDLEDHPHLADVRETILKWLATDESKRVDGDDFKYEDGNGKLQPVEDELAIAFCKAYFKAGIRTFNRYFPVIEKISIWKNPPGLSRSERSFTGGSPEFSDDVGKYDQPPISLNGFPNTNYFKSKDSWVQNSDTTWTRTEQWIYTPESSSGNHAWIYNNLDD